VWGTYATPDPLRTSLPDRLQYRLLVVPQTGGTTKQILAITNQQIAIRKVQEPSRATVSSCKHSITKKSMIMKDNGEQQEQGIDRNRMTTTRRRNALQQHSIVLGILLVVSAAEDGDRDHMPTSVPKKKEERLGGYLLLVIDEALSIVDDDGERTG
jgi:hypothetical protein